MISVAYPETVVHFGLVLDSCCLVSFFMGKCDMLIMHVPKCVQYAHIYVCERLFVKCLYVYVFVRICISDICISVGDCVCVCVFV